MDNTFCQPDPNFFYFTRVVTAKVNSHLLLIFVLTEKKVQIRIKNKMCSNNQNPSETQPLLEEHVETGQIRLRNSKYRYYILAIVLCTVLLGAGLIIYSIYDTEGR